LVNWRGSRDGGEGTRIGHSPTHESANSPSGRFDAWLRSLEQRHLANLTRSELTRALRALSSIYVERREKIARGAALESAGKRAAFALFYGPLHFLTIGEIVRAIGADRLAFETLIDLGCGTGASGAAWARACEKPPAILGVDRHRWAVEEADRTYRDLGLRGAARVADISRVPIPAAPRAAILLAYTVNEVNDATRPALLDALTARARAGTTVLVVEPIARRMSGWWDEWRARFESLGGRGDEWRFAVTLPPLLQGIATSARLQPRELTARSLALTP
jgi:hypothetical protein